MWVGNVVLLSVARAARELVKAIGQPLPSSYPEFFRAETNCVRALHELNRLLKMLPESCDHFDGRHGRRVCGECGEEVEA